MRRTGKTIGVPVDLEDELNHLYGVDLADFVPARTRLATSLRKDGRRVEAERVKELRKPSLSVWTINQLARRQRKDIDLLLDAGHRLAESQRALLTGSGDQEAFEAARKAEREAVKRLVDASRSILAERGSVATLERVTATLRAAAISDDAGPDLARGRLTGDVDGAGFDAFAGIPTSPTSSARTVKKTERGSRGADDGADRERELRQAATARCRDAISRAAAELKAAKERETTVAKQVREAERAERDARELLQRAEQAVGRLRADHHASACAVEAARVKVDEVRQ
jgi:hypothetical protein